MAQIVEQPGECDTEHICVSDAERWLDTLEVLCPLASEMRDTKRVLKAIMHGGREYEGA